MDNDLGSPLSQWRLYFSGGQAYTLGSSTGQVINLFDFGGQFSWILNDSSVTQTIGWLVAGISIGIAVFIASASVLWRVAGKPGSAESLVADRVQKLLARVRKT